MENDKEERLLDDFITKAKSTMYLEPITKGSLRASVLCLVCLSLSTSVLSMPYTMKTNGVILCLILFVISWYATTWTMRLLGQIALKEQIYDYSDLVRLHYGEKMGIITDIVMLINNLASIICYNIISNLVNFSQYLYDKYI
jgi:amino acid permease